MAQRIFVGTPALFVWRALILSWPRNMCSQVRLLICWEPSRKMPMERIMHPCGTLTSRHPQAQAHNQGEGKLTYPSLCSRPARYYEFCPFLYYLSLSFIVLVWCPKSAKYHFYCFLPLLFVLIMIKVVFTLIFLTFSNASIPIDFTCWCKISQQICKKIIVQVCCENF